MYRGRLIELVHELNFQDITFVRAQHWSWCLAIIQHQI